jgi:ParB family chromosome partitioning protein
MGHARALINVEEPESQIRILRKIISDDLSVRQVEEIVRHLHSIPPAKPKEAVTLPEFFSKSAEELREKYGAQVNIRRNTNGKGQIVISFESDQDFSRIKSLLDG